MHFEFLGVEGSVGGRVAAYMMPAGKAVERCAGRKRVYAGLPSDGGFRTGPGES